jgi:two-component system, NtrC family, sensor kinase
MPDLKLVRVLRGVFAASILIPLALFAMVAWERHREIYRDAERTILRQTAILYEHASKVLQAQELVIEQANDRIGGLSWAEIRSSAQVWNDLKRLAEQVQHVDAIFIVDPQGQSALTTRAHPSPQVDFSDRDYFLAQKAGNGGAFLSGRYLGKISARPIFNVSMRRETPGNTFDGVVGVSAFVDYFERLYGTVAEPRDGAFVSLEKSNGQVLASFPPGAKAAMPLVQGANQDEGLAYVTDTTTNASFVLARRKLPGFPAYVVFGMDESFIESSWHRTLWRWGLLTVLSALGMSLATGFAFNRAKKEASAVEEWKRSQAALLTEVERRQEVEAALLQSHKLEALGQLTTGVAHDFRNLLQILKGHLGIAKARAGEDRVRRAISTCESAVERSEKLIQHLLAFARRQPLVYELFDLNERLPAMRETLQQVGSNLRIQLELGKDLWPVEGDSTQLELVLINLVANARDAMPDGGVVEVGASNRTLRPTEGEVEGDFVELRVRDYGVGILPETLGRVWEPFFTTKGAGKGTGLGLASVYGFAKQSGGFAKIESEVGAGTTVSIFMRKGAGMRVLDEIDTGLKTSEAVVSFAKRN